MGNVRILHVVNELNIGGIQVFVMNVYRNINRNDIQFDFLLSSPKKGVFEDEIEKLGGHVYRVTSRHTSVWRNYLDLKFFFAEHGKEYEGIHCHFSNLSYITPLVFAFKANIPVRIIHSHSTNLPNNVIHKCLNSLNKKRIGRLATHYYACSDLAGKWLYDGSKASNIFKLINNGIETERFKFNSLIRHQTRKGLGIENKTIYGTVGTYCDAKNHPFTLRLFSEVVRHERNSVLIMAGIPDDNIEINGLIKEYGLQNHVKLLGMRKDIPDLLQAMDVFLMPSKWEGFPVSLLEAQASGLTCYVSDTVTRQAKINDNVFYLSLEDGAEKWAEFVIQNNKSNERVESNNRIIERGFDISSTVKYLENVYLEATNNNHD